MTKFVQDFSDLKVYKKAIEAAVDVYKTTKVFPPEEKYSVDTVRTIAGVQVFTQTRRHIDT